MFKVLRIFYGELLKKKFYFFAFITTIIISSILYSIPPYISRNIIDTINMGAYEEILPLIFIFVGSRYLGHLTMSVSRILEDKTLIPASISLRTKIFDRVQNLDFAFHVDKSTGSLISAFKRGDGALWGLAHNLNTTIFPLMINLVIMALLFSNVDPSITIILVGSFVISFIAGILLVKLNVKRRTIFNEKEDEISGVITDNLINYETVQYFSAEERELQRLTSKFSEWEQRLWKYMISFRVMGLSLSTISSLGALAMLWIMSSRLQAGLATPGEFIMVISFILTFYYDLLQIVWSMRNIAKNMTDMTTYISLLDNESYIKNPIKPTKLKNSEGEVIFQNVHFSYPGTKQDALKNIDVDVSAGSTVAFAGHSGAGKSTIIKLILRLYDVDQGSISIDEINIKDLTKSDLRSLIGIVPQEPILFNNTAAFNIGFGKKGATQKEIEEAAKIANIHDFIMTLPKKYKTLVGERGVKLSGGQKQRVAIARAIIGDPKIIIFDEATSNLDSHSEALIQEALWEIAENRTLIIIAHRFSTIMGADKIVVLKDGSIDQLGSHEDLSKKKGTYKDLWDLQS